MSYDEQTKNHANDVVKIYCHSCLQKLDVTTFPPFSRLDCPICHCELTVPEKFGKFQLEEKFSGNDAFSVYRAYDTEENTPVLLTVFSADITGKNDAVKNFEYAIDRASVINGAGNVPVLESGIEKDRFFFASKYMAGGNLERRLRDAHNGAIPLKQTARWMLEAAKVLAKAKKSGIVHGDIKPENIFFDDEGRAYVGNFGINDVILEAAADNNLTFIPATTPCYMSPEKLMRSSDDGSEDVFSLGAVFYRLATGKQAFSGVTTEDLIHARLDNAVTSPASVNPEIPENVSSLITAMMSFDKDSRPSYEAVISVLSDFVSEGGKVRAAASNGKNDDDCCIVHKKSSFFSGCLLIFIVIILSVLIFFLWQRQSARVKEAPAKTNEKVSEEISERPTEKKNLSEQILRPTESEENVAPPKAEPQAEKKNIPSKVQASVPAKTSADAKESPDKSTKVAEAAEVVSDIPTYNEKEDKTSAAPTSKKGALSSAETASSPVTTDGDKPKNGIDSLLDWMDKFAKDAEKKGSLQGLADWEKDVLSRSEGNVAGKKLSSETIGANEKKYCKKGRPMPAAPSEIRHEKMKDYILSLPKEMQKPELMRAIYLGDSADFIVTLSKLHVYTTKGFTTTKSKKIAKGAIAFSPDHLLVMHDNSGKHTKVAWDELPYGEFMNIVKYYVNEREKIVNEEDSTPNPIEEPEDRKERNDELGRAFLRLALLYDWYGKSNEAANASAKALKYAPGLKKTAEKLLLK